MKVVITQGEAAGIGPEVLIKALSGYTAPKDVEIRVLGDPQALEETAADLGLPAPEVIEEVEDEVLGKVEQIEFIDGNLEMIAGI